MNASVEDGEVPAAALPFGFRGLPVIKTTTSLTENTSILDGGSINKDTSARITAVGATFLTSSIFPLCLCDLKQRAAQFPHHPPA